MSSYWIVRRENDLMIVGSSKLGVQPMIIARMTPEVPISMPKAYVDFVSHLENLLDPATPRAQSNGSVERTLITEETYLRVSNLRQHRVRIQLLMEQVAVNNQLSVVIGGIGHPELSIVAIRGVLNQLMDDFAHNGNAIREMGFEPPPMSKSIAEAVEAVLAVFLEPAAAE
jgi:hypothetical protein